jgi:predicted nucleic acid-binding protein
MQRYVFDTNIWIYLAENNPELAELQYRVINQEIEPVLTPITYIETLGYAKITLQQEQFFLDYFADLEMLFLKQAHLDLAVAWRRQDVKTKLPDLLVAACSKIADIPLLTRNEKDFISLDVRFENPWKMI